MFGLRGLKIVLFKEPDLRQELRADTKLDSLSHKTIYVAPQTVNGGVLPYTTVRVDRPVCHYVNVDSTDRKGTLLLENPRGDFLTLSELQTQVQMVIFTSHF